jgi:hypothetical protein
VFHTTDIVARRKDFDCLVCSDGTVYKLQGSFADHKRGKLHTLCIIGDIYGNIKSSSSLPSPCVVVAIPPCYCHPFSFCMGQWMKSLQTLLSSHNLLFYFLLLLSSFFDVFCYDCCGFHINFNSNNPTLNETKKKL